MLKKRRPETNPGVPYDRNGRKPMGKGIECCRCGKKDDTKRNCNEKKKKRNHPGTLNTNNKVATIGFSYPRIILTII